MIQGKMGGQASGCQTLPADQDLNPFSDHSPRTGPALCTYGHTSLVPHKAHSTDSEKAGPLPEAAELLRGRARTRTQAAWLWGSCP